MEQSKKIFLEHIFQKQHLALHMGYFEAYYVSSLQRMLERTSFDIQDFKDRMSHIEATINPDKVFTLIANAVQKLEYKDNAGDELSNIIKKLAAIEALETMINQDNEIVNKLQFIEERKNMINDGSFFDKRIEDLANERLEQSPQRWEKILNQDVMNAIEKSLNNIIYSS